MSKLQDKHVLIIGGGVAGCAAALFLQQVAPGVGITIVEKGTASNGKPSNKKPLHPRIGETLPAAIAVLLQRLNLWQGFIGCHFLKANGTSAAWGSADIFYNESISSPYGGGWHVDRTRFDQWLLQETLNRGVQYANNRRIKRCIYDNNLQQWICILESESPNNHVGTQTIYCDFIIDASGRNAQFARSQGAKRIADDKLVGIYYFFDDDSGAIAKNNHSLVESHADGWWYSAKLPHNRWVVALMSDADIVKTKNYKSYSVWRSLLSESNHTAKRLHHFIDHTNTKSKAIITAAHSQILNSCIGKSWLACGDAASTYDPLSSLGIFKAFRTAMFSAYAIKDYLEGINSPAAKLGLQKYQYLLRQEYNAYQQKKMAHYDEEKRFNSIFWCRRQTRQKYHFPPPAKEVVASKALTFAANAQAFYFNNTATINRG